MFRPWASGNQGQLHTTLVSWLKQLGKALQGESQLAYQLEGQLEVCKAGQSAVQQQR
jgi:hypothetical protein